MEGRLMRAAALSICTALLFATVAVADQPAATVDGKPISMSDVENHIRPKLIEIETQRYEALREGVDEMIAEELLTREAKARKISEEELVKIEIVDKIPAPSDADVQKVYDDNKEQLNGQPLEAVKPQIVNY